MTTYIGDKETVRGIPALQWQSTLKHDDDYSLKLDYFFSQDAYTYTGQHVVPLRAVVNGTVKDGSTVRQITHVYDFTAFEEISYPEHTEIFQIPRGVYCSGKISEKSVPDIPTAFSMIIEQSATVDEKPYLAASGEVYDYDNKLLRITTYVENAPNITVPANKIFVTQIHDYNSGVAFIINDLRGNCTTVAIADVATAFEDIYNVTTLGNFSFNVLHMKGPMGIFEFDQGETYYNGKVGVNAHALRTART
ncbi:PREDICTED: uncharacterized protein LOC106808521 [Priapulus caudatus]|uniref:Uncharacterized protein LOC106808521 n=1 Tax=Priapulus caudatus TaxID=37621 RepID=A0ABM1E3J3_PRICU|nr:PREDICTED: uncharacterized protein LOC106808521 [Priapulus caudatus]